MKNKNDKRKLLTRIACFALAALMVVGAAYMTIYVIMTML
jgi:hypothetical protein